MRQSRSAGSSSSNRLQQPVDSHSGATGRQMKAGWIFPSSSDPGWCHLCILQTFRELDASWVLMISLAVCLTPLPPHTYLQLLRKCSYHKESPILEQPLQIKLTCTMSLDEGEKLFLASVLLACKASSWLLHGFFFCGQVHSQENREALSSACRCCKSHLLTFWVQFVSQETSFFKV